MVDDIQTTASNLRDLSRVTRDLGFEFTGFRKQLLDAASATDGAGKMWTNYSRILSGTALWKLQNYFRGALGFVAEHNKKLNTSIKLAQKEQEQRRQTILNFGKIEVQYKKMQESAEKAFADFGLNLEHFNENQIDALESTMAFAETLALTGSKATAYTVLLFYQN